MPASGFIPLNDAGIAPGVLPGGDEALDIIKGRERVA
jgi:hypothetical protein